MLVSPDRAVRILLVRDHMSRNYGKTLLRRDAAKWAGRDDADGRLIYERADCPALRNIYHILDDASASGDAAYRQPEGARRCGHELN